MKASHFLKCILFTLFIGMNIPSIMAQKNIDKLLEEIERRDDASVNSVTKRDPKTRKITSVVKSFSLTDAKMTQRLIEAFEKDEEYTVTAIKDMPKGRKEGTKANFTFIFQKDNEKRTYSFSVNSQGRISLSVIIKQGTWRHRCFRLLLILQQRHGFRNTRYRQRTTERITKVYPRILERTENENHHST